MDMMRSALKLKGSEEQKEFLKQKAPSKTDATYFEYQRVLADVALAAQNLCMQKLAEDELKAGIKKSGNKVEPTIAAVVTRQTKLKAKLNEEAKPKKGLLAPKKGGPDSGSGGNNDDLVNGEALD
jgi:predicted house-cleaning noncanonical NTP pyrophosphatase (MazG superfamily)